MMARMDGWGGGMRGKRLTDGLYRWLWINTCEQFGQGQVPGRMEASGTGG